MGCTSCRFVSICNNDLLLQPRPKEYTGVSFELLDGLVWLRKMSLTFSSGQGTHQALLGTNPFCIGIPASNTPVIYDIGTSKIIHAEVMLARRLGQSLPEDVLYDAYGNSVVDPNEAFNGPGGALSAALAVWGGAKGSGLALAVQLLGIVAGSPALPPNLEDFGFLVMMINPAVFRPMEEFKAEVENMRQAYHKAPTAGGQPLRVPFERSERVRREARERGWIDVEEGVIQRLKAL